MGMTVAVIMLVAVVVAMAMIMAVAVAVVMFVVVRRFVCVFVFHGFSSLAAIKNPVATTKSSGCRIVLLFFIRASKNHENR